MRLLLVNPNASSFVTERIAAQLMRTLPGCEVVVHTDLEAPAYIDRPEQLDAPAARALELIRRERYHHDGAILGCFSDAGLAAARATLGIPALTLADGSIPLAAMLGEPFAIVTGGDAWIEPIRAHVQSLGFAASLAAVRATGASARALVDASPHAMNELRDAISRCESEDGARVILFAGGGLAGLAEMLQPGANARLLDCVACTARTMAALFASTNLSD